MLLSYRIRDLSPEVLAPADVVARQTLFQDKHLKVVLFDFAWGQDLSEHTASLPTVMRFMGCKAKTPVGEEASAGGTQGGSETK